MCADSADFNLSGLNLPTHRWNSSAYSHANDTTFAGYTYFGGCNALTYTSLYLAQANSDLIQQLRNFINTQ